MTTYAERMAAIDRQRDEEEWRRLLDRALNDPDYEFMIEDLIAEGVDLDYDIPVDVKDTRLSYIIRCAICAHSHSR